VTSDVRLNHMSLRVRSLEASCVFYRDILQLAEIACGAGKANIRWFGLGASQSLHLIEGNFENTYVAKSTHFCVSSTDFDGLVEHFRNRGIPFGDLAGVAGKEHRRADGVRSVYLQDPDGYWIEVNEDF
jgi:lactoylglutathione lyase